MVQKQSTERATDVAIDTVDAVLLEVATPGDPLVSLNIEATAEASYAVDVTHVEDDPAQADWFEGEETYDAANLDTTDLRDGFQVGDARMRVRVTSAAANGETADVTIQKAH